MGSSDKSVKIIAEVGSVHDGSFGNALRLIELAADCGADVVKFQTHIAEAETLRDAPMPPYFKGEPRYEYFQRTAFTFEQWQAIRQCCHENKVAFLSSPFSIEAVELLENVGVDEYKVGSGEVSNTPLLKAIGATGKTVLLSSGMSTWSELDHAVETLKEFHDRIVILQCTSEYPCPYEDVGFNVMREMSDRYQLPTGFSDHTLSIYAPLAAVCLGATAIEKHFTFSRKMYGSDARHSLEPSEFADMVTGIRAVEQMVQGRVDKDATARSLKQMKDIFEKSVVSTRAIPAGTTITSEMVAVKKPGTGIPARFLEEIIGSEAVEDIPADSLLHEQQLSVSFTSNSNNS